MENIAILGAGEMGTWFAEKYRDLGRDVTISDLDLSKAEGIAAKLGIDYGANKEAIGKADEVMLAVSLDAIGEVIDEHQKDLEGRVVYDIASVKNGITKKLQSLGKTTYSIHPMWGGAASDFQGQNLISIPTHSLDDPEYLIFFRSQEDFFRQQGVNVRRVANEEEHDKLMAETLAIYHFSAIVLGSTISGNGLSFQEHHQLIGTTATMADASIESVVHSSPRLYAEIQMGNFYFPQVMDRFIAVASGLRQIVVNGSIVNGDREPREQFTNIMRTASDYFRDGKGVESYLSLARRKFMAAVDAIRTTK